MGHAETAAAFLAGGSPAYVGPRGGPFRYATALFPILLFYELTEGRSLRAAVERVGRWDAELAMCQQCGAPEWR
jgi:hypothetical protein